MRRVLALQRVLAMKKDPALKMVLAMQRVPALKMVLAMVIAKTGMEMRQLVRVAKWPVRIQRAAPTWKK